MPNVRIEEVMCALLQDIAKECDEYFVVDRLCECVIFSRYYASGAFVHAFDYHLNGEWLHLQKLHHLASVRLSDPQCLDIAGRFMRMMTDRLLTDRKDPGYSRKSQVSIRPIRSMCV